MTDAGLRRMSAHPAFGGSAIAESNRAMSGAIHPDAGSARWFSRIVRRETAIGVAINSVVGCVAFLVVFGFADPVP